MSRFLFTATDQSDTERLGEMLAQLLPPGTVVALIGTLGAGKTRLVQALGSALGIPRESVVSPTFVLCQEYRGSKAVFHLDAYRLRDEDEFYELGPQEWFESDALTVIEWADRIVRCLPDERLEIRIEVLPDEAREFEIRAVGKNLIDVVDSLRKSI